MKRSTDERERLLRIISLCLSIEKRGENPFEVEVKEALKVLRRYLPHWDALEDFALDAETLNRISSIVSLQGNWIKRRSSTLFVDPLLIELKVKMLEPEKLFDIFRRTWRPIIEMDRLSSRRVTEAVEYWNQLLPLDERLMRLPEPSDTLSLTSIDELVRSRIIDDASFTALLREFWLELKARSDGGNRVHYWDFIYAPSYEETVFRAYITSFLLTYGFATMEINPVDEEEFLTPNMEPREASFKEKMVSVPLSIDHETWKRIGEEMRNG